jgi:hypothetical protein
VRGATLQAVGMTCFEETINVFAASEKHYECALLLHTIFSFAKLKSKMEGRWVGSKCS